MSFQGEPPSWLMRPEGGGDRVGLAVAGHDAAAIAAVAGGDKERLRAERPERPARGGRGLVAPPCRPVSAMGEGHATTPPLRRRPRRAPRPARARPCPECSAKPVSGLHEHDVLGSRALALPSRPCRKGLRSTRHSGEEPRTFSSSNRSGSERHLRTARPRRLLANLPVTRTMTDEIDVEKLKAY